MGYRGRGVLKSAYISYICKFLKWVFIPFLCLTPVLCFLKNTQEEEILKLIWYYIINDHTYCILWYFILFTDMHLIILIFLTIHTWLIIGQFIGYSGVNLSKVGLDFVGLKCLQGLGHLRPYSIFNSKHYYGVKFSPILLHF